MAGFKKDTVTAAQQVLDLPTLSNRVKGLEKAVDEMVSSMRKNSQEAYLHQDLLRKFKEELDFLKTDVARLKLQLDSAVVSQKHNMEVSRY